MSLLGPRPMLDRVTHIVEQMSTLVETIGDLQAADGVVRTIDIVQQMEDVQEQLRCLRVGLERDRLLYDSAPEPLLVVDRSGVICECNQRAIEFFRGLGKGLIGLQIGDAFHRQDANVINEMAKAGWAGTEERVVCTKDGFSVSIKAAAIFGASDIRYHLAIRNESVRLMLEKARDYKLQIEAIANFSALLAVDMNDSVSIVQGRMELVLEIGTDEMEVVNRHLRIALDHARKISTSLQNLRLLSRDHTDTMAQGFVEEALQEALQLVGPRAVRRHIQFEVQPQDLSAGVEPATFARVLSTMLGYVFDAVSRGDEVVIRAYPVDKSLTAVQVYGGPAVIAVDDLLAVPKRTKLNLSDSASGPGLTLVRMLVQRVGGNLEGWRSGGSILLTLTLPLPQRARKRPRSFHSKVLFVGQPHVAERLRRLIVDEGVHVDPVETGEQAMERVRQDDDFDAVVFELFLKGMSGLTLAQQILHWGTKKPVKLVLLAEVPIGSVMPDVEVVPPPWSREAILKALGQKPRRLKV